MAHSSFIDKVPFTLPPWIRLIDTNTNVKEQQIFLSESIQKKPLKLILLPPEWKRRSSFFLLFLPPKDPGMMPYHALNILLTP